MGKRKKPDAPKTKKFDGKTYKRWMFSKSKQKADKIAEDNREVGTPARVTKYKKDYIVYLR